MGLDDDDGCHGDKDRDNEKDKDKKEVEEGDRDINIAKGTTDPRVEFISQVQANLDHISSSES